MPKISNSEDCLKRLSEGGNLSLDEEVQLTAAVTKAKLFDELLPILARGDAKALENMRRRLMRRAKATG
jgi:hypothetical protein